MATSCNAVRITITAAGDGGSTIILNEIEVTGSGGNLNPAGGVPVWTASRTDAGTAAALNDVNYGAFGWSSSALPVTLTGQFSSTVSLVSLGFFPHFGGSDFQAAAPKSFTFETSTDGGATWVLQRTVTNDDTSVGYGSQGACTAKTFAIQGTGGTTSLTVSGTAGPATVGTAYSVTFTASGGTAPYTYSVGSGTLPAGTNLNTSTGVVSGTPTTAATSTFVIHAVDSTP